MADAFIGEVRVFPYGFNPDGWILCDGSALSIQQYTALYAIIGTYYGTTKTPQTTFFVPKLTGKAAIGTGTSPTIGTVNIGNAGGTETRTLTTDQLPTHDHTLTTKVTTDVDYFSATPTERTSRLGRFFTNNSGSSTLYKAYNPKASTDTATTPNNPVEMGSLSAAGAVSADNATISLMQPYCAMGFYICWAGAFPQRT